MLINSDATTKDSKNFIGGFFTLQILQTKAVVYELSNRTMY